MKTIIAGSRNITVADVVESAIEKSGFQISDVISGGARGVDLLGERWARDNNLPITRFVAEWDRFGKSAGYIRNKRMAAYGDALIAVWNGRSRGTKHMIEEANKLGLKVFVYNLEEVIGD